MEHERGGVKRIESCVCGGAIVAATTAGETMEEAIPIAVRSHQAGSRHLAWRMGFRTADLALDWASKDGLGVQQLRERQ